MKYKRKCSGRNNNESLNDDKEQQLTTLRENFDKCKDREEQLRQKNEVRKKMLRREQQRVTELQKEVDDKEQQLTTLREQLVSCQQNSHDTINPSGYTC